MFKKISLIFLFYILQFHGSSALSNTIIDKARASLGVLGEIRVIIVDDAEDGCWTNMSYIKELAEENLAKAGAIVVTKHNNKIPWAKDGRTAYAIRVVAERADTGQ
jgi:hypothetical protein